MVTTAPTKNAAVERAADAIEYIRRNDCDFLTIETVQTYAGAGPREAAQALIAAMGMGWFLQGLQRELERRGWDVIPGQLTAALPDGRMFAVVKGRRWTRIAEYLTNGQLTARWFVDERTGEAREAEGARKPKRWPMAPDAQAFVRQIVAQTRGEG